MATYRIHPDLATERLHYMKDIDHEASGTANFIVHSHFGPCHVGGDYCCYILHHTLPSAEALQQCLHNPHQIILEQSVQM